MTKPKSHILNLGSAEDKLKLKGIMSGVLAEVFENYCKRMVNFIINQTIVEFPPEAGKGIAGSALSSVAINLFLEISIPDNEMDAVFEKIKEVRKARKCKAQ